MIKLHVTWTIIKKNRHLLEIGEMPIYTHNK